MFKVLYVLCFSRPRYQVSVHRTIGPLVSFCFYDIELNSQENLNDGICIEQLQFYLLLFADDAVLFSETREGLQNHLTLVNVYVALPVFTSVAGRSYAHFMEQNGGAHDINR